MKTVAVSYEIDATVGMKAKCWHLEQPDNHRVRLSLVVLFETFSVVKQTFIRSCGQIIAGVNEKTK